MPQIRRGLPIPLPPIFAPTTLLQIPAPRSGYRGSDLVRWHRPEIRAAAATESGIGGEPDAPSGTWEAEATTGSDPTADIAHPGTSRCNNCFSLKFRSPPGKISLGL